MSCRLCFVLSVLFFIAGRNALSADEIVILSLSPSPPATLDGIAAPPPGSPISPTTSSNSVTVVVRYRTDGGANRVTVFPHLPTVSAASVGFGLVPPVGSVPPCERISGPSEGQCAAAFALICDARAPSSITIDRVGASLIGEVAVATDYESPARYTFRCPPRSSDDCVVTGVAGQPGETPLPISRKLPVCRCLQDEGAREFRCAILHPDFFIIRRIPFPLLPGEQFSEVWEFLPLTKLNGSVTMTLTGGGLGKPLQQRFGAGKQLKLGAVERFVIKGVAPKDLVKVPGLASFQYQMKDASDDFVQKFDVDRTIDETMLRSQFNKE